MYLAFAQAHCMCEMYWKVLAQEPEDRTSLIMVFVREHSALGKTPAEQAGIRLDLGQNKIKGLMEFASKR